MKKFTLFIFSLFIALGLFAQAPQLFQYQTVVRDNAGLPLANQSVSLKFNIHKTTAAGTIEYAETHNATTNDFGLVNLIIGDGTVISGTMNAINWEDDLYFIEVELDPSGGSSYTSMGTSQLLSVPYALSSGKAANMTINDLTNVQGTPTSGQVLKWDGTVWKPQNDLQSGGGGGSYSSGVGINISGSNIISATLGTDIATAELQNNAVTTSKIANDAVTATKIDDMGASSGQVLKWNGSNWAPAADATGSSSTTYTGGTGININGSNVITATLGTDIATAELQNNAVTTAKIANDAVTMAKIDDAGATTGQVIKWNGTNWAPSADNAGSSAWTVTGNDVTRTTGNVGIGIATPTNLFSVLHTTGISNTIRFQSDDHPSGKDLLELIVPTTAPASSQFIEFQKGATIVAAINSDGSAEFEAITFGDNTTQTTAAISPIAFGNISTSGTIFSGSGNYTVTYNSTFNRYEITITGESYFYSNYTTMVTPVSSTVESFYTSSGGGKLHIHFKNSSGTAIQANFQFIVYK